MTAVRIPPTLRAEAGGERQLEADGETVREVLEQLAERYPALGALLFEDGDVAPFVNVYLGGEDVRTLDGLDTQISNGQTVILLPAMAGGSGFLAGRSRCGAAGDSATCTDPEGTVPRATRGGGGAGLRPAGAAAGQGCGAC